jgi:hypothetical protein
MVNIVDVEHKVSNEPLGGAFAAVCTGGFSALFTEKVHTVKITDGATGKRYTGTGSSRGAAMSDAIKKAK